MGSYYSKSFAEKLIETHGLKPRVNLHEKEFEQIYRLPLTETHRDQKNKIRKCEFKELNNNLSATKAINILLLGTTGSGKTTTINSLINYMAHVQFNDKHRLEIVDLEDCEASRQNDQTQSQTEWITVYRIGRLSIKKLSFEINVIDTPGFGDTRGKVRDEETLRQMRYLLQHTMSSIHAVCLVLNGTLPRLDERQKYIFDRIGQVFPRDISRQLYIMATFTNDDTIPVLSAVESYGLKYARCFAFENRDLCQKIPLNTRKRERAGRNYSESQETWNRFFKEIQENCSL